jgi:hypothetical protein
MDRRRRRRKWYELFQLQESYNVLGLGGRLIFLVAMPHNN